MALLFMMLIFTFFIPMIETTQEILVESPFYLRARIHDSHTASVLFEIAGENNQRTCQMYKFTIRRNQDPVYSMSEQNLTFWRNSLELKKLAAGNYRVCAIICSEHLRKPKFHYEKYMKKNRTMPITACVRFDALRSHLLVLTLYILVLIILILSHIMYSLRKRQFQARVKMALIEVESSLQKWRSNPSSSTSTEHIQSSNTMLQGLVILPITPVEHSVPPVQSNIDEQPHPITFHLEISNE